MNMRNKPNTGVKTAFSAQNRSFLEKYGGKRSQIPSARRCFQATSMQGGVLESGVSQPPNRRAIRRRREGTRLDWARRSPALQKSDSSSKFMRIFNPRKNKPTEGGKTFLPMRNHGSRFIEREKTNPNRIDSGADHARITGGSKTSKNEPTAGWRFQSAFIRVHPQLKKRIHKKARLLSQPGF